MAYTKPGRSKMSAFHNEQKVNRRRWGIAGFVAALVAAGIVALAANGSASANHDGIACNDDVPAGWSCVPMVNKVQAGPGVPTPAFGELLYKFPDADTMWIHIRPLNPTDQIVN